jgi:invasion protein IalB
LGTLLTEDVVLAIDGGGGKRYPFSLCDQEGYHAQFGLKNDGLESLKKGGAASVTVVPFMTRQPLILTMSLKGFTAAYTAVKDNNALAAAARAAAKPATDAAPAEGTAPAAGEKPATGN